MYTFSVQPSRETVPVKWNRVDVLPDAGGVVHAGQVEGRILVAPVEGLNAPCHGRMKYKDTEPYRSAFLQN